MDLRPYLIWVMPTEGERIADDDCAFGYAPEASFWFDRKLCSLLKNISDCTEAEADLLLEKEAGGGAPFGRAERFEIAMGIRVSE